MCMRSNLQQVFSQDLTKATPLSQSRTHTHMHTDTARRLPNSLNHIFCHLCSAGLVRKRWVVYLIIISFSEDSLTKGMHQNSPDFSPWAFHPSSRKPSFCQVPQFYLLSHMGNFLSLYWTFWKKSKTPIKVRISLSSNRLWGSGGKPRLCNLGAVKLTQEQNKHHLT